MFRQVQYSLLLLTYSSLVDITSAASIQSRNNYLEARSGPNVRKILQLTDFHLDQDYSVKGSPADMCHVVRSKPPKTNLGEFGDHKCDSPRLLVESAIMAAKELVEKPDFILWTGDSVPHINNYDEDYVANTLKNTTDLLKRHFPDVQILPVYGNHDYSPSDSFPDMQSWIYFRTFEMWKPWIGEAAETTFLNGGFYSYTAVDGTVFLMLNTNLYYTFNTVVMSNSTDPAGQFEFIEKSLESAQAEGKAVHVVAHIAPGVFESKANFTWMYPHYNRRFLDITVKYSKTIKWMLFGHHHTDTFHLVKNQQGENVQLMLMAPAVTPWYGIVGSNNPAFRVFEYHPSSWEIEDIKTYYVSLDALNKNSSTKWALEYSMKDAYSMNMLSPDSFANLVDQFESNENSSAFQTYMQYNTVMNDVVIPQGANRSAHICALKYADFDDYYKCLENKTNGADTIKQLFQLYIKVLIIVAGFFFAQLN